MDNEMVQLAAEIFEVVRDEPGVPFREILDRFRNDASGTNIRAALWHMIAEERLDIRDDNSLYVMTDL